MGTLGDVEARGFALHPLGDRPRAQTKIEEDRNRLIDSVYEKLIV